MAVMKRLHKKVQKVTGTSRRVINWCREHELALKSVENTNSMPLVFERTGQEVNQCRVQIVAKKSGVDDENGTGRCL